MAGCETETASLSATTVGVPTAKRRMFVVAIKKQGDNELGSNLIKWKRNVERPASTTPTVGSFLGKQGSFFLKRGRGTKEIFPFNGSTVTITREHIMARKLTAVNFTEHARAVAERLFETHHNTRELQPLAHRSPLRWSRGDGRFHVASDGEGSTQHRQIKETEKR